MQLQKERSSERHQSCYSFQLVDMGLTMTLRIFMSNVVSYFDMMGLQHLTKSNFSHPQACNSIQKYQSMRLLKIFLIVFNVILSLFTIFFFFFKDPDILGNQRSAMVSNEMYCNTSGLSAQVTFFIIFVSSLGSEISFLIHRH